MTRAMRVSSYLSKNADLRCVRPQLRSTFLPLRPPARTYIPDAPTMWLHFTLNSRLRACTWADAVAGWSTCCWNMFSNSANLYLFVWAKHCETEILKKIDSENHYVGASSDNLTIFKCIFASLTFLSTNLYLFGYFTIITTILSTFYYSKFILKYS